MDLREHDGENIAKVLYIGDPADLKDTAANLDALFALCAPSALAMGPA